MKAGRATGSRGGRSSSPGGGLFTIGITGPSAVRLFPLLMKGCSLFASAGDVRSRDEMCVFIGIHTLCRHDEMGCSPGCETWVPR